MHKVLTRAYFKKHFFFVGIQNGEMVVAALLKHRDKPDIKLDRLYSSRGDNINQNGAKKFSKSLKEPAWYLEVLGVSPFYQGKSLGIK
ncbi:hypothetical protein [Bacillus sp. FSL M8-0054]|uniref:hypothetical protein n=1 Tax=Bacillus sp. FSL M8-0054 TaxID=2921565 RepID=UPI0030DDD45B